MRRIPWILHLIFFLSSILLNKCVWIYCNYLSFNNNWWRHVLQSRNCFRLKENFPISVPAISDIIIIPISYVLWQLIFSLAIIPVLSDIRFSVFGEWSVSQLMINSTSLSSWSIREALESLCDFMLFRCLTKRYFTKFFNFFLLV